MENMRCIRAVNGTCHEARCEHVYTHDETDACRESACSKYIDNCGCVRDDEV